MSTIVIPENYYPLKEGSPFTLYAGPYYEKRVDGQYQGLALHIQKYHLNTLGVVHGGVLLTMADNALGFHLIHSHEEEMIGTPHVTMTMSSEFLASAKEDDWVESDVRMLRKGNRVAYLDCILKVGERQVFHATASFSMFRKKQQK